MHSIEIECRDTYLSRISACNFKRLIHAFVRIGHIIKSTTTIWILSTAPPLRILVDTLLLFYSFSFAEIMTTIRFIWWFLLNYDVYLYRYVDKTENECVLLRKKRQQNMNGCGWGSVSSISRTILCWMITKMYEAMPASSFHILVRICGIKIVLHAFSISLNRINWVKENQKHKHKHAQAHSLTHSSHSLANVHKQNNTVKMQCRTANERNDGCGWMWSQAQKGSK